MTLLHIKRMTGPKISCRRSCLAVETDDSCRESCRQETADDEFVWLIWRHPGEIISHVEPTTNIISCLSNKSEKSIDAYIMRVALVSQCVSK